MEKYRAEITIPLGGSYSKYVDVVNYLNRNGKIISQSRTSPYDWEEQWCSFDDTTSYQITGLEAEVSLNDIELYDSDARQGSLARSRLVVSGADQKSIDDFINKIRSLIAK